MELCAAPGQAGVAALVSLLLLFELDDSDEPAELPDVELLLDDELSDEDEDAVSDEDEPDRESVR